MYWERNLITGFHDISQDDIYLVGNMKLKILQLRQIIREALQPSDESDIDDTFQKFRDLCLKNFDIIKKFNDLTKKYHISDSFEDSFGDDTSGDYSEYSLTARISRMGINMYASGFIAGLILRADSDKKFSGFIDDIESSIISKEFLAQAIKKIVIPRFPSLLKFMKNFISRKAHEEENVAEEDDTDPLGRIAFAPDRLDVDEDETNTPEENSLLTAIKKYMQQSNIKFPEKDADLMIDIFEKGLYRDMFKEPTEKYVFRAVQMSDDELKDVLNLNSNEELPEVGTKTGEFVTYNKSGKISSWTKDFQFARKWLRQGFQSGDKLEVIFYASPEKNRGKMIDVTGTYNVKNLNKYNMAEEVFGIGKIVVDKVIWAPTWSSNYDFRIKDREKKNLPVDKWLHIKRPRK